MPSAGPGPIQTDAELTSYVGDDTLSVTRDPRRARQRKAAADEHLKSPLVREILGYLADKSFEETKAIRDTVVGEVWQELMRMRNPVTK